MELVYWGKEDATFVCSALDMCSNRSSFPRVSTPMITSWSGCARMILTICISKLKNISIGNHIMMNCIDFYSGQYSAFSTQKHKRRQSAYKLLVTSYCSWHVHNGSTSRASIPNPCSLRHDELHDLMVSLPAGYCSFRISLFQWHFRLRNNKLCSATVLQWFFESDRSK